jgi:tetratricopeptide (TPR) repeat protein
VGRARKEAMRNKNSGNKKISSNQQRTIVSAEKPLSYKSSFLIVLALIAINIVIYAPTLQHGFSNYDDPFYVRDNTEVSHGLTGQGVIWAFTATHAANWHPLTWLSHMLDVQLFGMNAGRHHIANILLHIINSILLFWVLRRTTGAWFQSALVAFLFAVHPLHVESVAWISERKDVLCAFFGMLTFHAYINYTRRPLFRNLLIVIGAFSLGLMAKPMLVSLPILLLLFDIWPLHRVSLEAGQKGIWLQLIREKIPLFAIAAVSCIITVIAQSRGGAVQSFDAIPLSSRTINALASYVVYIGQMLWPGNLAAYYPFEPISAWLAVFSILILIAASIAAFRFARLYPYLLAGWIWYLCALLPVIGLVQVGGQARADRYTYMPHIGLFIMAVWGIAKIIECSRDLKIAFGSAAVLLVCALTIVAREQVHFWKNDVALWERAVQVTPENCFLRANLGMALVSNDNLEAALEQYSEALRLNPDYSFGTWKLSDAYAEAHNAQGVALFKKGLWREAILHYEEALRVKPELAEAYSNMGTVLGIQGKAAEAVTEFEKALKLNPKNPEIHYNMGLMLAKQDAIDEAISHYQKALEIKPLYAEPHKELGDAFFIKGKIAEALKQYSKALEIKPDFAKAHCNMGLALMFQKQYQDAIAHFSEALRLEPDSVEAQRNMASAQADLQTLSKK